MEIQTEEPVFTNLEPQQLDDQVYLEDADNQNEKPADTMEVEEEPTGSGQGVAPVAAASESVEVTFFQNQKLPEFKEEMKKLLGEGLPAFVIKPLSQERIVELLGKVEADAGSEANKEILIRLLAEKVESSHGSQAELAKKCKEYIDSMTTHFGGLAETFYMDLICNHANLKAYLDLKINYLDDFMMNTNDYSVWEIKRNDLLDEITIKEQVKVVKEQRKWKTKALTALDKLIKGIQKIKNAGDMPKVWALKTKYDDVIQSKKPDYAEKPPKANKRKHKNLDEPPANEVAEIEEAVGSMKKLKLSSAKNTVNKDAVTPSKTKVSVTKTSANKNAAQTPNKSPAEVPVADAPVSEEAKKGTKTPVKKEVEKKDNNQKNLMSFFTKKPVQVEEPKIEKKKEIVVEQTSRFKCLGSLGVRSEWDDCRAAEFDKLFGGSDVVSYSTEDLLEAAKRHNHHLNTQKEVRKVFISIHDSYKRIKGRWDTISTKIAGRDPLYKDETLINYEMDSEDEMQEYNAENIDEDHPSDNESDLDEGEEEDFIVPDGYVSAEEVANDSDNEGDEKERLEMRQSIKMFKEDVDFKNKPKMLSLALNDYEVGKDAQLDEYLQDFTIIKLIDDEYPIRPKRGKENLQGTGKAKLNPEAINDDEIVRELLFSLHGEFNKPDTVKKINIKFPTCSKNSIERKISELEAAEHVKKEKISGENKSRWIIQKEFFLKYGTEEEYNKILEEKHEKEVERLKAEKEKRETEKKAKQVTLPTNNSQNEGESDKKSEVFEEEIRETSNHSSVGGRKVIQTQLKFGQSRLNLNQNSNTQHSFYSCQVEVEIEGENSQNLERILMEREGNMPPTTD